MRRKTIKKNVLSRFPELGSKSQTPDNTLYTKEYARMTFDIRTKLGAFNSSNNGRCWWVYDYLVAYPNITTAIR